MVPQYPSIQTAPQYPPNTTDWTGPTAPSAPLAAPAATLGPAATPSGLLGDWAGLDRFEHENGSDGPAAPPPPFNAALLPTDVPVSVGKGGTGVSGSEVAAQHKAGGVQPHLYPHFEPGAKRPG